MYNDLITLDFETHPIERRPNFPPEDVGLAIKYGYESGTYLAHGHPTGNTATRDTVHCALHEVWDSGRPVLFHNAKFDLAVCYERYGLPQLRWDRIHDTSFLAFLCDPHARSHGLKPLAEAYLGWPPEEKDAIGKWVWDHRKALFEEYGVRPSRHKGKLSKDWFWFGKVPADVIAPYAIGDVDRTHALFRHFYAHVCKTGMHAAYDRERELMPILYENERDGIRVDMEALEYETGMYTDLIEHVEYRLRERLGDSGLNFDADADVAEALSRQGIVKDEDWSLTKTGQKSISKDNLKLEHYQDPHVFHVLGYRNRLCTATKMFMEPWLRQGSANNGYVSTTWNQTRGAGGGTRTGRPSTSSPNLLNITKSFEKESDEWEHPEFLGIEHLPCVRKYVLADSDDHLFCHRDFSGQELRMYGHFECGPTTRAYLQDPNVDIHQQVQDNILGLKPDTALDRGKTKILNFQSLYGGGAPATAKAMPCSLAEAKEFKRLHDQALPGRVALVEEITRIVRRGDPIHTWGGRRYYPEEPKFNSAEGYTQTFEYKLINYLIQGSAADLTKQAIIDWYNHPDRSARFLVTVYDEINISTHRHEAVRQMAVLKEVMEAPRIDVAMLSDGKYGPGWGELTKGDPQ